MMNDMAHPVAAALAATHESAVFDINHAHIMRSQIIGKCAAVENWLSEQISPVEKPELMLSQKIEQLKKLSDQKKVTFKHPQKLKDRLEAFRLFSDFRSEIAHSEMTISVLDGEATVIFENANQTCQKTLRKKILISIGDLGVVWQDMQNAAYILTTLKPTPPS